MENGDKLNTKKLDELKAGPYEIIAKISNTIYKIDIGYKNQPFTMFQNFLY